MTRRGRFACLVSIPVAILAAGVWLARHPRYAVDFVDGLPGTWRILAGDSLNQRPSFDFGTIAGVRIRYPEARKTDIDEKTLSKHACFIDVPAASGEPMIVEGERWLPAFTTLDDRGSHEVFGLPYATAKEFQDVRLIGVAGSGKTYRVRLPATPRFGPSRREPQTVRFGGSTMTIRPRIWKYTTDALEYDFEISGEGGPFLLRLASPTGKPGSEYVETLLADARLRASFPKDELVRPLSLELGGKSMFKGSVIALKPVRMTLMASRKGGSLSLRLLDGSAIFEDDSFHRSAIKGMELLLCQGSMTTTFEPLVSPDSFTEIKNGQRVEATAYIRAKSWPISFEVEGSYAHKWIF